MKQKKLPEQDLLNAYQTLMTMMMQQYFGGMAGMSQAGQYAMPGMSQSPVGYNSPGLMPHQMQEGMYLPMRMQPGSKLTISYDVDLPDKQYGGKSESKKSAPSYKA